MKNIFTAIDASLYIDGELPPDKVEAFEETLKHDSELAEHIRVYRKLDQIVKEDLANINMITPVKITSKKKDFRSIYHKKLWKTITALAASLVFILGIKLVMPPNNFNWQPAVSYSHQYRNMSESSPPQLLDNDNLQNILAPALEKQIKLKLSHISWVQKTRLKYRIYGRPIRIGILEHNHDELKLSTELYNTKLNEWEKIGSIKKFISVKHFEAEIENFAKIIVNDLTHKH